MCCPAAGHGWASEPHGTRRSPGGSASPSRPSRNGSSGWRRQSRSACRCGAGTSRRTRAGITSWSGRSTRRRRCPRRTPPVMIGGSGERKTLRLVAKYAQACNLFPGPDLAHKLDVLRGHCDAEGRDYDEITKTCYFAFDVGEKGEKAGEVTDQLGKLAEMGFEVAIGVVANVWDITPLEVMGAEVIPAVAGV